jgi:hypothetical protein
MMFAGIIGLGLLSRVAVLLYLVLSMKKQNVSSKQSDAK